MSLSGKRIRPIILEDTLAYTNGVAQYDLKETSLKTKNFTNLVFASFSESSTVTITSCAINDLKIIIKCFRTDTGIYYTGKLLTHILIFEIL